jgi:hypothetical protein
MGKEREREREKSKWIKMDLEIKVTVTHVGDIFRLDGPLFSLSCISVSQFLPLHANSLLQSTEGSE